MKFHVCFPHFKLCDCKPVSFIQTNNFNHDSKYIKKTIFKQEPFFLDDFRTFRNIYQINPLYRLINVVTPLLPFSVYVTK